MTSKHPGAADITVAFGPYRFDMRQRTLTRVGQPVHIPSRARSILAVLIEHAGEVVTKHELMSRIWKQTVVGDTALRMHVSDLRRRLQDGKFGLRYIESVTGKGYRFVATARNVEQGLDRSERSMRTPGSCIVSTTAAFPMPSMIGRDVELAKLMSLVTQSRLLSLVGPGGVGKTTLAAALACHAVSLGFDRVNVIELGSISASDACPSIGALIDLETHLCARTLVVINDCDFFATPVARQIEALLAQHPNIHVLVTTRERLRSKVESVFRVPPLSLPGPGTTLSAAEAQDFGAIKLFVHRASEACKGYDLPDSEVMALVDLCHRLDGLPLAIELAARGVGCLGMQGLASNTGDGPNSITPQAKTSPPRHLTLRASFDWSYGRLSAEERTALDQVSVFSGAFDIPSAQAMSTDEALRSRTFDIITSLVDRSMIMSCSAGDAPLFQLLETTRSCVLETLANTDAERMVRNRHSQWCLSRLTTNRGCDLKEIRTALKWCFSPGGDPTIGAQLTAYSLRLWLQERAAPECEHYIERTLQWLRENSHKDSTLELELYAALAEELSGARQSCPDMSTALDRALADLHVLNATVRRRKQAEDLWLRRVLAGDYRGSLQAADEYAGRVNSDGDASLAQRANHMQMVTHHLLGEHAAARTIGERLLNVDIHYDASVPDRGAHLNQRVACYADLARILWMQGLPGQALAATETGLHHAAAIADVRALCRLLASAGTVMLWAGRRQEADRFATQLIELALPHRLDYWRLYAWSLKSALASENGLTFSRFHFELVHHPRLTPLHLDQMATLDTSLVTARALHRAERGLAGFAGPEILRAQGEKMLRAEPTNAAAVEALFKRSLTLATAQSALMWQLRAATSLARLWRDQGRPDAAYELLHSVYARFTEGVETPDLQRAATLMDDLNTDIRSRPYRSARFA